MKKIIFSSLIITIILVLFMAIKPLGVFASFQEIEKVKAFGPVGQYESQYSPWVMHENGWGSYLMYYCKNTPIDNVWRDRVWRTESWTGGKTDWIGDQIVIEGTPNQDDDLSCSPGVVIAPDGTWHMYYVAANRTSDAKLYLYHATAQGPGVSWTKQGQIAGEFPRPYPGYMETPSPMFINGKLLIFFVGEGGFLYKTEALDNTFHNFSAPVKLNSPSFAQGGRVLYRDGTYYYAYSKNPTDNYQFSTHLYLSVSQDGLNFSEGGLLSQANGSDWDSTYMWVPHLLKENDQFRVYYAGNTGKPCPECWPGAATSIGLRIFNISTLTCDYPWADIPPITHLITKETNKVKVNLGFTDQFGGIGVKFELTNKNDPNNPINILEARSGAGSAWQFSGMITGYNDDGALVNQAAGNNPGYQWGYSNDLFLENNGNKTMLKSRNWAPNPTDTMRINGVESGSSPCSIKPPDRIDSAVFDEGQPTINVEPIQTSNYSVIKITHDYSLRSLINQYWKMYIPVSGFYLNRKIAREKDLRVYLVGKDGWREGPIRPYDDFTVSEAHGYKVTTPEWDLWQINETVKYVLFVYHVSGEDIGILVPDIPFGATLRLDENTYCPDTNDDTCGSIDFGRNDGIQENISFLKGIIRKYTYEYVVGTIPELEYYVNQSLISFPGDFNQDTKVDIFDLREFMTNFLQVFTLFDYSKMVENFGL